MADTQLAQAVAYVAYAYSRREGANSLGKYHLVLNQPLDSGRLHRMAEDALCRPGRKFWGLEPRPGADVDCPRCLQLAGQHGVPRPTAVQGA